MGKLSTVVLGAIGGFIAGVLLAPKSGKETRDELKQKATEGLEKAKSGANTVKGELTEGAESIKGIAKDAAKDASRTANRIKDEVSQRASSIKSETKDTTEDLKRTAR